MGNPCISEYSMYLRVIYVLLVICARIVVWEIPMQVRLFPARRIFHAFPVIRACIRNPWTFGYFLAFLGYPTYYSEQTRFPPPIRTNDSRLGLKQS